MVVGFVALTTYLEAYLKRTSKFQSLPRFLDYLTNFLIRFVKDGLICILFNITILYIHILIGREKEINN